MSEKPSSNQWEKTAFGGDDATKAKFRRLMGIKEGEEDQERPTGGFSRSEDCLGLL